MARPRDSKNDVRRRLELEAVELAAADRRKRLRLAAGATIAVAAVVTLVVALGPFSDPTDGASRTTVGGVELTGIDETRTMLRGIPQHGTLLGDPDAAVTIHEFADLKCPACRRYAISELPETITALIRTGEANLRLQLLNIIDPGHGTTDGAGLRRAAYNLAPSNSTWSFAQTTYFNQGDEADDWASARRLRELAGGAPGVGAEALALGETPTSRALSSRSDELARRLEVRGTPSFFVERRGTGRLEPVDDPRDLATTVRETAERAPPQAR